MSIQANPPPAPGMRAADAGNSEPQDLAEDVAGQAQEKAQAAAGQVQDKLREQLDQRSSQAAERINEQASDLRSVSQALREKGKDGPAEAADRMAGYAERVGGYLRDKGADSLLHDAEDLGRRQPGAVAAGALLVGLAASRFLKASSSRRYSSRTSGQVASALPSTFPRTSRGNGVSGTMPVPSVAAPATGGVPPVSGV